MLLNNILTRGRRGRPPLSCSTMALSAAKHLQGFGFGFSAAPFPLSGSTDSSTSRHRRLLLLDGPQLQTPAFSLSLSTLLLSKRRRRRSSFSASVFKRADVDLNLDVDVDLSGESTRIRVLPLPRHLLREADVADGFKHGSPLGFSDPASSAKKMVVAVDVDEVLGSFLSALNQFIADRYSLNHSVSEYYVYEFFKIWNCSRDEADNRVHEFFKTDYFKSGIHPIPGAWSTLHKLSAFCQLSVVTSRQNIIRDHTLEWIEKHYPGLFHEVHFGNHFALSGQSRPKSEICRSLGAQVLIDDNPRYALECADIGIKVLLFDYDNSYPWCKSSEIDSHPLVTKVHNWPEVERHLFSWIPT